MYFISIIINDSSTVYERGVSRWCARNFTKIDGRLALFRVVGKRKKIESWSRGVGG